MIRENRYHFEDDAIGLIFPIYGFGIPKIVRRFLEKADWKADYSFAIGTYGNIPGAAMTNLAKFAGKRRIQFDYMVNLLMVDNFLPGFERGEQIERLPQKKTDENLEKIVSDIHTRKTNTPKSSLIMRVTTALIQGLLGRFLSDKAALDYIINEKCTCCGVCARVCPTGNISVNDKVTFGGSCEACLGCVQNCPQNAIHLKNEKSATRFRNVEVTLKEIQDANCQI
jgi:ferredoxin